MKRFPYCVAVLLSFSACIFAQDVKPACSIEGKTGILAKIETYKAPPFPYAGQRDLYDRRTMGGAPVPKTFTDTFICDMWEVMARDLGLTGISPTRVTVEDVNQAINVYLTKNWEKIAGYRPWTNHNFIKCLTKDQLNVLAQDVVKYMAENGVKDAEKK